MLLSSIILFSTFPVGNKKSEKITKMINGIYNQETRSYRRMSQFVLFQTGPKQLTSF